MEGECDQATVGLQIVHITQRRQRVPVQVQTLQGGQAFEGGPDVREGIVGQVDPGEGGDVSEDGCQGAVQGQGSVQAVVV